MCVGGFKGRGGLHALRRYIFLVPCVMHITRVRTTSCHRPRLKTTSAERKKSSGHLVDPLAWTKKNRSRSFDRSGFWRLVCWRLKPLFVCVVVKGWDCCEVVACATFGAYPTQSGARPFCLLPDPVLCLHICKNLFFLCLKLGFQSGQIVHVVNFPDRANGFVRVC